MLKRFFLLSFLYLLWSCSDFHAVPPGDSLASGKKDPHGTTGSKRIVNNNQPDSKGELKASASMHPIRPAGKKRITAVVPVRSQVIDVPASYKDSLFLLKLRQLQLEDVELDLSEPSSREYLFSELIPPEKRGYVILSRERFLKINFDNDIFDNTDRYYTNGIRIDIVTPFLKPFPLNYLMIPYWGTGVNYYGISIVQNMYTPSTTKVGGILYGDRPYAAYLYLGTFKISNDPEKKIRQTTELDLGIIGPYSFGGFIQKSFHAAVPTNNEPLGWLYQIQNDVVLNYEMRLEKGIISRKNLTLNLQGAGALGTLYTNLGGGFLFRTGWMNPYFDNLGISRSRLNHQHGLRNSQFYFFLDLQGHVIGYDATLQGGLFNRSSVYTLESQQVSRFTFEGCAGITLNFGGFRLDVGQYILSPEFHQGWWHHWVHTGVTFAL